MLPGGKRPHCCHSYLCNKLLRYTVRGMILLPFLQELWLEVTLGLLAWLGLPMVLVWRRKTIAAAVVLFSWGLIFCGLAYWTFGLSTRLAHANRDGPLALAFIFLIWTICALSSLSFSATLALGNRSLTGPDKLSGSYHP